MTARRTADAVSLLSEKPDPAIRKSPSYDNGSTAADRNGYPLLTNRRRLLFAGGAFHADGRIFRGTSAGARSPPLGTPRFASRRGRGGRAGDHPRPVADRRLARNVGADAGGRDLRGRAAARWHD